MRQRSDFPVFASGFQHTPGDAPIMLDGMEVVFDRTVGLYPVHLDASGTATETKGNGKAVSR